MIEQVWKKIMRFLKPAQPSAFFNDETLANPYPAYEKLRFQDPVHWYEADERWLLTRNADVVTVLRSPSASSARAQASMRFVPRKYRQLLEFRSKSMINR